MGSSQDDLRAFPEDVQDVMGYALHVAQKGGKHASAKSFKGGKDWKLCLCVTRIPEKVEKRNKNTKARYRLDKESFQRRNGSP